MNRLTIQLTLIGLCLCAQLPALAVTIPTVLIGDANNPPDTTGMDDGTTGYGSVNHSFYMATYEVTNVQYCEFLNAKAKRDDRELYSDRMGSDPTGGITRSGANGNYSYTVKPNMGNKPVNFVNWFDAIRFANWLHNGQGNGSTDSGAYAIGSVVGNSGTSYFTFRRTAGAKWFLPNENEWYKAAYYQPAAKGGDTDSYWQYPTASNLAPTVATANSVGEISNPGTNVANYNSGALWVDHVGAETTVGSAGLTSRSYYGTSDQGGNIWEWTETYIEGNERVLRGGNFHYSADYLRSSNRSGSIVASEDFDITGFRVAAIPEPGTLALAALGALGLLIAACRMGH